MASFTVVPSPQGGPPSISAFPGPQQTSSPSSDPSHGLSGLALDRGPLIMGIVLAFWILSIIALGLRLVSRYFARNKFLWDDWFAILAWVLLTAKAMAMVVAASPSVGGGQHIFNTTVPQLAIFLQLMSVVFLLYPLIMSAAKASILFFYIRLFGINRGFRYCCYVVLVSLACWAIALFFSTLFMCGVPISNAWEINARNRQCINQTPFFLSSTALDAFFDLIILCLPLRPVWKLKLSTRKKWAISGALVLGTSEVMFTVARFVVWNQLTLEDVPWDFFQIIVWSAIQESVGVICVCLPALGPLFHWRRERSRVTYEQSNYNEPFSRPSGPTSQSNKFHRIPDDSSGQRPVLETELNDITKTAEPDIEIHHLGQAY